MKFGSAQIAILLVAPRCTSLRIQILIIATLAFTCVGTAWSHEDGAPPGHTGGFREPTCTACHFDNDVNSVDGELTLDGVPESFIPGHQYEFIIVVKHLMLQSGGFQLTVRNIDCATAGELSIVDKRAQITTDSKSGRSYAQHSKDSTKTKGIISWLIRWHAPMNEDKVIINIAANAANDDASAFGDYIYFVEKKLKAAAQSNSIRLPQ